VHQPELDLTEPLAAELGVEVGGPQPLLANLVLERLDRPLKPVPPELVVNRLQRPDPFADKPAHPIEAALELGLS
jgi:hypothetical protein